MDDNEFIIATAPFIFLFIIALDGALGMISAKYWVDGQRSEAIIGGCIAIAMPGLVVIQQTIALNEGDVGIKDYMVVVAVCLTMMLLPFGLGVEIGLRLHLRSAERNRHR